jgi:hypothetical protein
MKLETWITSITVMYLVSISILLILAALSRSPYKYEYMLALVLLGLATYIWYKTAPAWIREGLRRINTLAMNHKANTGELR